ncbi:L,D-transpeptidase family protein [Clostridium gasigenes]|uniref:Putative peptidoglycan binding domain-containing protein n=1 Tax=Clostridium gasigenes TaxID=94869 RepID=A0A1H0ULK5_9CLOT|nr:L,D-transpeptidase family protein [Clostridium gasigenes]SDP67127.1 Putative peptidoglycan binding domain-containing protein [Clostridium gasigenes]
MKEIKPNKVVGDIIIVICVLILVYVGGSIYFIKHFNFGTIINGVNVSGKTINKASEKIANEINRYKLELKERGGVTEEILVNDIDLKYNSDSTIQHIKEKQNEFEWMFGLVTKAYYKLPEISLYDEELLREKLLNLSCINGENIVDPKSVSFKYGDGAYTMIDEVYGNKINEEVLYKNVENAITYGEIILDLEAINCYENPKYISSSKEAIKAKEILDKYNSSEIIYTFNEEEDIVDSSTINNWININEDLDVMIDEKKVKEYVGTLATKYNTVGKTRDFKTSYGNEIQVHGGYYGWKINTPAEVEALIENIRNGEEITKEPLYLQSAVSKGDNDIGDTYVEISINRQYLWFYKNGKIVAEGDIVTGDISKGFKTSLGTYMLNYKQKNATLEGENYSSKVKYWMPFNGNIGIHDASWRYSFGGNIYKESGTHGCVNAPEYLAKKIFENIEDGIPIICYYE